MLSKLLKQATKLKKEGDKERDTITEFVKQEPQNKQTPLNQHTKIKPRQSMPSLQQVLKLYSPSSAPTTEVKREDDTQEQKVEQPETEEPNNEEDVYDQYQQLLDRLRETDKKYSTEYNAPEVNMPQTLGTKRVDYVAPNEQELYTLAQEALRARYLADEQKIKAQLTKAEQKAASDKAQAQIEADNARLQAEQELPQQLQEAHNKALKQGIGRSSIAQGMQNSAQDEHEQQLHEIAQEEEQQLFTLQQQLQDAKANTEQAMAALGKEYDAQKVAEVNKLLEEVSKKLEQAAKYNNSLAAAESKYQITRHNALTAANKEERQRLNDIVELYSILGAQGVEQKAELEKFAAARSFFDKLDKQTALNLLTASQEMKHYLGDYYTTLLEYVKNKKE